MAKALLKSKVKPPESSVLPLPTAVVEHHQKSLNTRVNEWFKQDRVPPVLLFTGQAGIGKRSVSYYLAQWLFCEVAGFTKGISATLNDPNDPNDPNNSDENDLGPNLFGEAPEPLVVQTPPERMDGPCGKCASCLKASNGTWVDFTEISSQNSEDDSGSLKIEQFRQLKASQGFGAYGGGFKIVLIRDADRMTIQAANSLLKILEEPPKGWIFLLTATDSSLLLPTLVSRCQVLRLKPFEESALKVLLRENLETAKLSQEKQALCAHLAQGSWGRALRLASEDFWERRESFWNFIESPKRELNAIVDWAAQEAANLDSLLDQLELVLSDWVKWTFSFKALAGHGPGQKSGLDHTWQNSDGAKLLLTIAERSLARLGSIEGVRAHWLKIAERAFKVRGESRLPLNKKLLIQDLLLQFLV